MVKMIRLAGAVVGCKMGEASVDELNVVLAGWSHDTGSGIIGDRDRAAGVSVADVQGEVQAPRRKADMLIDSDGTDSDVKW